MFKVFQVGEESEFIVAATSEEAVDDHWERIGGNDYYETKDAVPVLPINLDAKAKFEQEDGSYKEQSFRDFIGNDFVYQGPQVICWQE
ncbi:hypothetical protein [Paenibacillus donghaensis]|uniref:Uncharacterized protein n=1 Tax=Paenibacillus donghaensis TaxID=414771 RepID=A0A2Z2K7D6_9BACL|nr:hypothetical protein [Paenibacillus donghaensis]ASA20927.1 hypothetical protein B9T62_09105 [Paenibacillus donghaensis]